MKNSFATLIFLLFTFPPAGSSQDNLSNELRYEVNRIYPPISKTKENVKEAQTLSDLNPYYKSTWIKEYISVEILTSYKGGIRKAMSKNDTLSQEQIEIMNSADVGKDIMVKVLYIPENTLKNNDSKLIDFSFHVEPESEAKYPGGKQRMDEYLKEKAIDKIPDGSFQNYDLAAVRFTINEEGEIIDPQIFESSKDEKIDALLLQTISRMPCWKPAEYANGVKIAQDFVLTVGNHENCIINLLNISKDRFAQND